MATKFQMLLSLFLMDIASSSDSILCDPSANCTINCLNVECVGRTLFCPMEQSCAIKCHTKHSCSNTTVLAKQSSHLNIYTLSPYAACNSNIYCPSSPSSLCQIYGDTAAHHQWHKINLHIKEHNHYQFICQSSTCATDATISLFSHSDHKYDACKLSNITYECISPHIHHHGRKLLSPNTTITTVLNKEPTVNEKVFGMGLSAAQLSWILFASAVLLIVMFCVIICLLLCIWKQKRQRNGDKVVKDSHNLSDQHDENASFKYLILSYQDGRKLKVPIDITTIKSLNPQSANHKTSSHPSHRNYISDSLRAALDIDHNKIISVDIVDTNPDEESQNTVVASLHIDNEHSPIDIVLEDMDSTALRLPSSNPNSTLIKVGNTLQKQHIVQNSMTHTMTNSMELMNNLKKYKMRKGSDGTEDKGNESSHSWSNETLSDSESDSDETQQGSDNGETLELKRDKRREQRTLHHQSSSHPQILVANKANKRHKKSPPKRPKTAHPKSPKDQQHSFNAWTKSKKVSQLSAKKVSKSPQNSSLESDESIDPQHSNDKQLMLSADVPSIRLSTSAPTHPQTRMRTQHPMRAILVASHDNIDSLTPSKKGLRRSPLTLPKPARNKRNHPADATNVYKDAATMKYQMAMHHRRRQRKLRNDNRHNSEPSNGYKKSGKEVFVMGDMAPLNLKDDATDQSTRTRSKSHPTEAGNANGTIWDNEYAGFIINDEVYQSKHDKTKHNKRSKARHAEINKKNVNPFSRSAECESAKKEIVNRLEIPIYVNNGNKRNRLEAEHSATTNNTHYTETTISDTPIPCVFELNPMTMRPINTQMTQHKTTTISSAFIPPPPSPQLTQTKHYTLSPPNSLNTQSLDTSTNTTGAITQQMHAKRGCSGSTSTGTTHTFDGGTLVEEIQRRQDTESTSGLSQDTANSNANINRYPLREDGGDETDDTLSSDESDSDLNGDDVRRFSQHYIVNSNETDKMMYIPPVPMQHAHDENVPVRNPYSVRRLKPLPDGGAPSVSVATGSPLNTSCNYSNPYAEDEDEEKALNPSYDSYAHSNPYLTEPKPTINTTTNTSNDSLTFPNRASSTTHPPTFPSVRSSSANSHNNHNYFAHPLTEKEINNEPDAFIDHQNVWHHHTDINNADYVE